MNLIALQSATEVNYGNSLQSMMRFYVCEESCIELFVAHRSSMKSDVNGKKEGGRMKEIKMVIGLFFFFFKEKFHCE